MINENVITMQNDPNSLQKVCPVCSNPFNPTHKNQYICSWNCYRSEKYVEISFWKRVQKGDGCWIWKGTISKSGYGQLYVLGKRTFAHRYSYVLQNGKIPEDKPFICHHCDTPTCVREDHLFAGTPHDNTLDCISKKRFAVGEKSGRSVLSEEDVAKIRERTILRQRGPDCAMRVALDFGISRSEVCNIVKRQNWKHC